MCACFAITGYGGCTLRSTRPCVSLLVSLTTLSGAGVAVGFTTGVGVGGRGGGSSVGGAPFTLPPNSDVDGAPAINSVFLLPKSTFIVSSSLGRILTSFGGSNLGAV